MFLFSFSQNKQVRYVTLRHVRLGYVAIFMLFNLSLKTIKYEFLCARTKLTIIFSESEEVQFQPNIATV